MSVHIVALGNEKGGFIEESQAQPNLITTYFGRNSIIRHIEERRLLSFASHTTFPAFAEYQACVFGRVRVLVHDCPSWDLFDNDWYSSRNVVGQADIIVLKYSINDKASFQDVKDNYVPMIKRILNQWTIPVIVAAVGARQNEDGPPCSCPLCTSDKGSYVPSCEGLQLSKEIGATYLELHSLNDFYVGKYFGGVLEYFIIQSLKQKSSQKDKKKKRSSRLHVAPPPRLTEPVKLPCLKIEDSRYHCDLLGLFYSSQCADVAFCCKGGQEVARAHRVVLCTVSQVFMFLFGVANACELDDSSGRSTLDLFVTDPKDIKLAPNQDLHYNRHPIRVIIRDSLLCASYPEILKFIYTGADLWEELESTLCKKLTNAEQAKHVLEIVKCLVPCNDKMLCSSPVTTRRSNAKRLPESHCCTLSLFFKSLVLADVVFKIQASILQAMALFICAEMYQVPRLQQICESYIVTQLQSMPSRELTSTNLSIVNLLKKAKFHNAIRLSTWLLHFIASNYLIFSQKVEFQELSEEEQAFVENHRWPSSVYLQELTEYRHHMHSRRSRCSLM
ncbi:rho-related BTB domain-containing protein 3 isoform X3 [Callorhinchus milii]|uniref:Rho related BTB domain containing 3 n=1 Tax=Callorhinchus milii TaxID=7868 RepID=A0A4W3JSG4_CALMI|nr:rho-related BTB domain-containing protein 3 isoform X3 [Callorhinchus milii]|eukprot:gi/632951409/ref/XP_007891279.1/ PREDICTED: rho-related BTB domain-containing protein 3 isoform X3 [Callorhinchus milii]